MDAWTNTLEIKEERPVYRALRVVEQIQLMYEQLEAVRRHLVQMSTVEDLYVPYMHHIEEALNASALSTPWSNYKGHLRPDTLLALVYCSTILPNEEDQIEATELIQLLGDIEALEGRGASLEGRRVVTH